MSDHLPELGNLMFGHSRGKWPVPRTSGYEEPLHSLIEAIRESPGEHCGGYSEEFDNAVFEMHNYWWGDEEAPEATRPNFKHKPSGLELRWYKYPLRDSYMSRQVSVAEWQRIIDECRASLKGTQQ